MLNFTYFKRIAPILVGISLLSLAGCGGSSNTHSPQNNLPPQVQQEILKAEEGDFNAQFNIGQRFATGSGLPQDNKKAKAWYEKAAQGGNVSAQYNLGYMYEIGQGTERNYGLAAKYYQMAAYQSHSKSQYNLGVLYIKGNGVTRSNVEAYKWFSISAHNGNRKARQQMQTISKTMSPEELSVAKKVAAQFKR